MNFEIANVLFTFVSPETVSIIRNDPAYVNFLCDRRSHENNITIHIQAGIPLLPPPHELTRLFQAGNSWRMDQTSAGDFWVRMQPNPLESPAWIIEADSMFENITLHTGNRLVTSGNTIVNPAQYPVDQIILMHYLPFLNGALIHSAGAVCNQGAFIFPGRSGAGKSTLTRLLRSNKDFLLLSDDRIIVRNTENGIRAFGTPWPGTEGAAENCSAPLKAIFFPVHGDRNRIEPVSPQETIRLLLPVTSIPWYDNRRFTAVLDFFSHLAVQTPSYKLYFKPDQEIVSVLEKF